MTVLLPEQLECAILQSLFSPCMLLKFQNYQCRSLDHLESIGSWLQFLHEIMGKCTDTIFLSEEKWLKVWYLPGGMPVWRLKLWNILGEICHKKNLPCTCVFLLPCSNQCRVFLQMVGPDLKKRLKVGTVCVS